MKKILFVIFLFSFGIVFANEINQGDSTDYSPLLTIGYNHGYVFTDHLRIPSQILFNSEEDLFLDLDAVQSDQINLRLFNTYELSVGHHILDLEIDNQDFGKLHVTPITFLLKREFPFSFKDIFGGRDDNIISNIYDSYNGLTFTGGIGLGICINHFSRGPYLTYLEQTNNEQYEIKFGTPHFFAFEMGLGYYFSYHVSINLNAGIHAHRGTIIVESNGQEDATPAASWIFNEMSLNLGLNYWIF